MQNITPTHPTQPHMWGTRGSHNPTYPHHPFRGVGGVGSVGWEVGGGLQEIASWMGQSYLQFSASKEGSAEAIGESALRGEQQNARHRMRARDADSDNDSTGNDTP